MSCRFPVAARLTPVGLAFSLFGILIWTNLLISAVHIQILRRYDFGLLNPPSPWNSFSAGIFIQSDLAVKVTRAP